ncbi:endonuclease/exonuclease/phosphatase family protein [Amycolatopsis taiwanensis]|uniref:endonuclease/exonuclease/phosphatase family protein n=1 Tax=Amycolatopsis taiwanensis TaxID=342230 RepID=UPI0004809B45|nr:endonuclease/exonuclease/phosphatase family protein [Amycolatopsis taiwanensis]
MLVFTVLAVLFLALAALRLFGVDGNRYTAALLALTPYWTACGMVLGIVALATRHWWIGAGTVAVAVALVAALLPRMVPATEQPPAAGRQLRIMSSNLYLGRADAKAIVDLAREHRVDVLNLLELTPREAGELERAGLFDLLPYRVFQPVSNGVGSGIASRYPLTELNLTGPSMLRQPSARVDLGGVAIEVVAVHVLPPTTSAGTWKSEIAGLPRPGEPVRILAGDFNATLDHATFRGLLDAGYTDAADRTGSGFSPTWPSRGFLPPVTIDHILVDARVTVNAYRVLEVPDSDHHAVYAELTLP